ncbi:helicase-like protein [Stackebrandtia albiflava]|uniref:Helicase-like protein n=1 Tax=Stackebrandtia albiflava TaxID=406432 RepID=A0A562ULA0_9ACTN|nr:DEAD/DEAH box helicase [Stackebrandtia albiflava]TWJ06382.1 helicase-like protein [Stackebrandtia albiflava]
MTAEPSRAGKKVGEPARAVIHRAEAVQRAGQRLATQAEELVRSIQIQVGVFNHEQAGMRLSQMPVTDLRKAVPKGMRLGSLEQAGYDTVAKVHAAPYQALAALPGIGPQTVYAVKEAAAAAVRQVRSDSRFRFEPDRRDPRERRLLATIAAERSAQAAVHALGDPLRRYDERIGPHLPGARKAASRWRMFWSGRRGKATAIDAVEQLTSVVDGVESRSLAQSLKDATERADPDFHDTDELWHHYEREAAAFNTALGRITGTDAADADGLEDFIGAELRQRIEATPFDASLLKSTLRMYQLFGAKYTIHQERVILGDEMGLGKTIQALAVCAHLAAKGQQRFLVVCPASVQANWVAETARHTHLRSFNLHGREREQQGRQWMRRGGVAVTTFNTLDRLDFLKRHPDLEPALLIVDEAHYIKNPKAKRSMAVAALNERAQRTMFLTGTPMENRVEEFRNLVHHLNPRLSGRLDIEDSVFSAAAFRRAVAPVYLRRNQEDVLTELPEKIEVEDWVQFNDTDHRSYRDAVIGRNLMGMRRTASAVRGSAKLDRLVELVEQAHLEDHKVVVFSNFLDVLAAVRERLGSRVSGEITGKVTSDARQKVIDDFTSFRGPTTLVAQIEAGGVGLNIQAASVVILAEPQLKPSTEQQAIARAHRMGQVRVVQVHRLLAKESVDERIREIQANKELLFEHFARRSDAKDSDGMATALGDARPTPLDDTSIPEHERVIVAERIRLGVEESRS